MSFVLLLDRVLDIVFDLQLRFQQVQKSGHVLADAGEAFDPLAEGCDLVGNRSPLCLVVGQGGGVRFVADPVAEL